MNSFTIKDFPLHSAPVKRLSRHNRVLTQLFHVPLDRFAFLRTYIVPITGSQINKKDLSYRCFIIRRKDASLAYTNTEPVCGALPLHPGLLQKARYRRYGLWDSPFNDNTHIPVAHLKSGPDYTLVRMLNRWANEAEKLQNGEITQEEYDHWRYTYPEVEAKLHSDAVLERYKADHPEES